MYHFILNPASQSGKAEKIWLETIEPFLEINHKEFQVHYSQARGNISTLVEEIINAEEDIAKIIVMGGDGALNEALQGIQDFTKVHLGFIPIGSSNDMTRDMKLRKSITDQLMDILSIDQPKPVDYGTVTYEDGSTRHFIVSCGIGFDAAVCEEANRSKMKKVLNKIGLGKLIYLYLALKQLLGAKLTSATLLIDGQAPKEIHKLRFIACMNHKYEGGGFMFAPDANYRDGIFNLCEVGDISSAKIIVALPTAFKGEHYRYKEITPHQASSFTIKTSEPQWVHTDGEVSRQSCEIHVECHTGQLLFLCS